MKSKSLRFSLMSLLVVTSVASYIFLNTVSANVPAPAVDGTIPIEQPAIEELPQKSSNLPDIKIAKKVLELTRNLFSIPN